MSTPEYPTVKYTPNPKQPDAGTMLDAAVRRVRGPWLLDLEVAGTEGTFVVENVPAAPHGYTDPCPGCYTPPEGAAIPVGYVSTEQDAGDVDGPTLRAEPTLPPREVIRESESEIPPRRTE